MKKYILLTLLFTIAGATIAYGQKQLTIKNEPAHETRPHEELGENEAIVILDSPCMLTFDSTMDKEVNVVKEDKENGLYYYQLKFSTHAKHNGRKLRIKSDQYETLTHSLALKSGDVLGLSVTDPYMEARDESDQLRDEGDALFNKCQYAEARSKYQEALNSMNAETGSAEDKAAITARLNKATLCMESKTKADTYYDSNKWGLAFTEYEKVLVANALDAHCRTRLETCRTQRLNETRVVSGIVRDDRGTILANATVIPGVDILDNRGRVRKTEYPKNLAVTTDANGRYTIRTTYKTQKLKCWKGSVLADYYAPAMEIEILDDVVNIVLRKGESVGGDNSSSDTKESSSSSTTTNSVTPSNFSSSSGSDKSTQSSTSTRSTSSESSTPKKKSSVTRIKPAIKK